MDAATRLGSLGYETIRLQVSEAILTVTIDRPEVLNALSPQVIAELRQVFADLRESLGRPDPDNAGNSDNSDDSPGTTGDGNPGGDATDPDWSIRGVIITGAGKKSFVAGADISIMRGMTTEQADAYARGAQELTSWIETLPVPVVAAVNGFALGGGCELAMACDYIYASENASFGQPEVGLGIIPGFGGCVRLQQYVGIAAARELIFTGRRIDVNEAQRIGLVSRVLPDADALTAAARESLLLVAKQSPAAVAGAKQAVRAAQALPTDAGLEREREAFAARFGSGDMLEGTAAFVEKRAPIFPGL